MNIDAEATAKRIASMGELVHTDDSELNDQGENLAKICDFDITLEELITAAVERW